MNRADHLARQRAYYDSGTHDHLRAQPTDRYASHLAATLAAQAGIDGTHRVVELGAGFGRFTVTLLAHCRSVVAVDLSPRALAELTRTRDQLRIAAERCTPLCLDADALTADALGGPVDAVVGFFLLHHLADFRRTVARAAALVGPGGRVAFLEPNRLNPLFLLQIAACPDMHWRAERGLYRIGRRALRDAVVLAGLRDVSSQTIGFFPPQIINRSRTAERIERRLERAALLAPLRPFVVVSGQRPL